MSIFHKPDPAYGKASRCERIRQTLKANPSIVLKGSEIAELMDESADVKTIQQLLSAMARKQNAAIRRVAHGRYALAQSDSYPAESFSLRPQE